MKKSDLTRLALLGMASGAMLIGQTKSEASLEGASYDASFLIAKPKCAARGGCGGTIADRNLSSSMKDTDEEEEIEEDDENYADDENAS